MVSGPTLIALTRSLLADLLAPDAAVDLPWIGAGLDATADAVLLGVDGGDGAGIDPTIAAITLAEVTDRVGLVVTAAPQRDHPYNLARRLASLDHATGGRIGVLITGRDPSAAPGSPWTTAPPDEAAADAVIALRELWRSFPIDAVVGDRETGLFAESHRIVAVDHRGAFDITGPLQVPWSPQLWPPVLAWDAPAGSKLAEVADLTIDSRCTVHRPAGLPDLDRLLAAPTLRTRLGLPPVVPPTTGRPAFPNPDGGPHVR